MTLYAIPGLMWEWDKIYLDESCAVAGPRNYRVKPHFEYGFALIIHEYGKWLGVTPCESLAHGQQLADAAHREWVAQFLTPWEPVLVWKDKQGYSVAETPWGRYAAYWVHPVADHSLDYWCWARPGEWESLRVSDRKTETLAECKAACQADYAARWEAGKP